MICMVHFYYITILLLLLLFCLFRATPRHMEVPRRGVTPELQLLVYTTVRVMPDPSHVCDLLRSSQQCQILSPLSGARDWCCVLIDTSWVCYRWATRGTPRSYTFKYVSSIWDALPFQSLLAWVPQDSTEGAPPLVIFTLNPPGPVRVLPLSSHKTLHAPLL